MMADHTLAERLRAALPVIVIHVLLGLLLLRGLDYVPPAPVDEALKILNLAPELPPPPVEEPPPPPPPSEGSAAAERAADPRPEGAASPPNLKARPTPVVAPEPVVPLPVPTPIVAAPVVAEGRQSSAGAAPVPGPGTGSGGVGNGFGSGNGGSGAGGGGGGGGNGRGVGMRPPRWIRGTMSPRDLPDELQENGTGARLETIYWIEASGRVTDCRVTRSSGDRRLDALTCRLIEQRWRYDPARYADGRPLRSRMVQDHYWEFENLPPDPRRMRRRGW